MQVWRSTQDTPTTCIGHSVTLLVLRQWGGSTLIRELVEIQRHQVTEEKSTGFIEELECLYIPGPRPEYTSGRQQHLKRRTINAFEEHRYVALSYTWQASLYEADVSSSQYMVQGRCGRGEEPSPVRDSVMDRVTNYMHHVSARLLWIDQHCIVQEEGVEKEIGMQAMDQVYSKSRFPVALLARPVQSQDELRLLIRILDGKFVKNQKTGSQLLPGIPRQEVEAAIDLLREITSDLWFTRGWTYQESYKAGERLKFLIRHAPSLRKEKRRSQTYLGNMREELVIGAVKLSMEASRLCMAYEGRWPESYIPCDQVKNRLGKFTILLQTHDGNGNTQTPVSMTPTIITDLTSRDLKSNWDRLPIAANCCLHSVRLNSIELKAQGRSLSLALLAQCLLNGEILKNNPQYGLNAETAQHLPIASFLKQQCFYGLRSPSKSYGLSYNKGCRFVNVKLKKEGIQTKGHLWKVDGLIPPDTFLREPRFSRPPSTKVQLKRLANELRNHNQSSHIPRQLRQFVDKLEHTREDMTFAMQWKLHMAEYVIDSIENSKMLCTARLLGGQPGCAIFVVECDRDKYGPHPRDRPRSPEFGDTDSETSWSSCYDSDQSSEDAMGGSAPEDPNYIFTSFQPGKELDRHVSMEVDSQDLDGYKNHRQSPRLYAKRWIHGLCFFGGSPRKDVIFPWPPAIRHM
ncbi:hypothetical protein PG993_008663 [Apiospora rasikravindrae]|uniref:Heterokaryon incompatibility domain-containing protein n=1 Tax=Apiospora rasikravindrae TaxID=990691 RepID=A0ABR1SSH5_9PEZI